MKSARLILSGLSFMAGAAAVVCWPAGWSSSFPGRTAIFFGSPAAPEQTGDGNFQAAPAEEKWPGAARNSGEGAAGNDDPSSAQGPAPTVDELFKASSLDRMLLMARFIQTASRDELKAVIQRSADEGLYEANFTDQAWLRLVELDRDTALKSPASDPAWWAFAKIDPQAALTAALKAGSASLSSVIHSIAQSDPALAQKLLSEHPELDPRMAESGIVAGWERLSSAAAVSYALEHSSYALEAKFKDWVSKDPDQALAWMRGLSDPLQRRRVEDMAFSQRIATDPAAGLKEASQLPAGQRQLRQTTEAIASLSRTDPTGARAAVDTLPTPYARQKALAALAGSLSFSEPAAAVRLIPDIDWKSLSTHNIESSWTYASPDGGSKSVGFTEGYALQPLVDGLMSSAPKATAEALVALPEESGAPVTAAIQKWAALEPEAASAWLKELPAGPARDQGIEGLTNWLVNENPEPDYASALAWADSASAEAREAFSINILQNWKARDPAAAAAAVANLPLDEARKAEILDRIK